MTEPRKPGRIREPQWTWESNDNDVRVGRVSIDGTVSIAELISHMQKIAPGSNVDDCQINFGTVRWTRPATAEELAEREQDYERQRVRREKWERDTLQRLTEKYKKRWWKP
jgi:hypothetical protein